MNNGKLNMESMLLKYFEGTAGKSEIKIAEEYLLLHPEYFENMEKNLTIRLQPVQDCSGLEEGLFKSFSDLEENQIMLLAAAYAEGDLTAEEKAEFNEIVKAASDKNILVPDFKNIKLRPLDDRLKHKNRLLKTTPVALTIRKGLVYSLAAAAVIILFVISSPFSPKVVNNINPATYIAGTGQNSSGISENNKKLHEINIQPAISARRQEYKQPEIKQTALSTINTDTDVKNYEGIIDLSGTVVLLPRVAFSEKIDHIRSAAPVNNLVAVKEDPKNPGNWMVKGISSALSALINIRKPESSFDVANQSIKEINKLLGWNMQLQKLSAADGESEIIKFRSDLVGFSTPVKKKQESNTK
jgi:hypothetical protein